MDRVLVVTDSTASLAEAMAAGEVAKHLSVIALHISTAGHTYREGVDIAAEHVVELVSHGVTVTTSQPSAQEYRELLEGAFAAGFTHVVSVHISQKLSGTVNVAQSVARDWPGQVQVIDSRTSALALGIAAVAGARAAARGGSAEDVAAIITERAESSGALFMVDSLDHLRRGGRLGAGAAAVGTVLGLKPLLTLTEGQIVVAAKVRSRNAALAYMFDRAIVASDLPGVEFGVHYFGSEKLAQKLCLQIEQTFGRPVHLAPVSAVLGAHVGPGLVALMYA